MSSGTDKKEEIPWSHLVEVPERYQTLGRRIEDTSNRAITVEMLEDLLELIKQVLDAGYEIKDRDPNKKVTINNIDLYHIDEHFVKPLTRKDQCSFVELAVSNEELEKKEKAGISTAPMFFVSHWWGTPLVDTIRMLKLHKKHDNSVWDEMWCHRDYRVWICAFANRQNNLDEEELDAERYLDVPFARAILNEDCLGTLLLLNENEATPLKRSWCIFEAFVSLTQCERKKRRHRMEIASIISEGSCKLRGRSNLRCAGLLSEIHFLSRSGGDRMGFMHTDHPENEDPEAHGAVKPVSAFPLDFALRGIKTNIFDAEASKKEDEDRIDKWVGSRAHEVNRVLRNKFLFPAIYLASEQDEDPELLCNTLEEAGSFASSEDILEIIQNLTLVSVASDNLSSPEKTRFFKILVQNGWDPNTSMLGNLLSPKLFSRPPLGYALKVKDYDAVRCLLEVGADPMKMYIKDTMFFHYKECPEDIKAKLKESGLVRKRAFMLLFCPCVYFLESTRRCCCIWLNPFWWRDALRLGLRSD